jgi:hypothetical protein
MSISIKNFTNFVMCISQISYVAKDTFGYEPLTLLQCVNDIGTFAHLA